MISSNLIASRLTLLYGSSGVGKTSVLNAGVLSRMRRLAEDRPFHDGSRRSVVVMFSDWREKTLIELKRAILGHFPTTSRLSGDRSLKQICLTASDTFSAKVLVILDQFEEYFL